MPMGEAEPGTVRVHDRTGRRPGIVLTGLVLVYGVVSLLRRAPLTMRRTVTWPRARLETLSPYQRRVLHLMATGMSNLAIAAELGVSRRAIENQVSRLLQALGLGRDNDALAARVCAVLMYLRETRPQEESADAVVEAVPVPERAAVERPVPVRAPIERLLAAGPMLEPVGAERPAAEPVTAERVAATPPVAERARTEPVVERAVPERVGAGRGRAKRSAVERPAAGRHAAVSPKPMSHVN